jgi:SAM-dependent methyltransferase
VSSSELLRCERCDQVYPNVGQIQCLIPDPAGFVQAALNRLQSYRLVTSERAHGLLLEARASHVSEKTRRRLERLASGLLAEAQCLETLFAPMRETAATHPAPLAALAAVMEDPRSAVQYWEHVFRDWVWGEAENARTRALLDPYLVEPLPAVAVLGAGTARLALDLANHPLVGEVAALDLNPLPFLVAERLLSGDTVELVEFPLVPLAIEHVAIARRIEPPALDSSKLSLIFADALRAPFADGSLDAVVTPWFIDAVTADLSDVAREINRVLRPGGLWLNVGPLYYSGSTSNAYSFEEACDIVQISGFELTGQQAKALEYFDSPVSGTCRTDRTYAFAARKVADAPPAAARENTAPWLDDPALPIPPSATLSASVQRSVVTAGIGSLVDGSRSLREITGILSESWGVAPDALLPTIRAFLSRNSTR